MRTVLSLFTLCLPVSLLYGQFFWNPVVFDDGYFFDGLVHEQYLDRLFSLDLRWLPYATLEWTRELLGSELIWFRLGNLVVHLATIVTLFLFLRRLFEQVLPANNDNNETLPAHWLAFFGALIFALHPVSVYAAGYLIQRSTLIATLFALLTWRLFLEGLIRDNHRWLLASAITYFLAVFSKEHAIMTPAVAIALLLLVSKHPIQQLRQLWLTFTLYGLIGGFVVFQVKSQHILGRAYELDAANYLVLLGADFDVRFTYPLSILTESFLFFKYLWVWLVPSPAWMSVAMPQAFAKSFWSWPETVGLIGFIVYPIIAMRLLLQKSLKGLLGFALLCPWLLFATEISTVRIQEAFVLYRSYLWMAGAFAALPFLCQKLSAKQAAVTLSLVALLMIPLSWLRLTTFSHPLLLWDDAARLVTDEKLPGIDRIFYNRGSELIKVKHYAEAIEDLSKSIELSGHFASHVYANRCFAYLRSQQYQLALNDINKAIELKPERANYYLGKAEILAALNDSVASMAAFQQACLRGSVGACKKVKNSESMVEEPLFHP